MAGADSEAVLQVSVKQEVRSDGGAPFFVAKAPGYSFIKGWLIHINTEMNRVL